MASSYNLSSENSHVASDIEMLEMQPTVDDVEMNVEITTSKNLVEENADESGIDMEKSSLDESDTNESQTSNADTNSLDGVKDGAKRCRSPSPSSSERSSSPSLISSKKSKVKTVINEQLISNEYGDKDERLAVKEQAACTRTVPSKEERKRRMDLYHQRRLAAKSGTSKPMFKKRKFTVPAPTLITLNSVREGNFKIEHKRSVLTKEECIEIQKIRIGSTSQVLSTLRPCQLHWLKVVHSHIVDSITNIKKGQEFKYPLGHDLFVTISEYENTEIVHLRYYHSGEYPSKNGITVVATKYIELANILFQFKLKEESVIDKTKLLVGQIVQNVVRTKLVDIEYDEGLDRGISILESFIEKHIHNIFEEIENEMSEIFYMYDQLIDFVGYPAIEGKLVVSHYYTDDMKRDIIHMTKTNRDYHEDTQMLIETVEDRDNNCF